MKAFNKMVNTVNKTKYAAFVLLTLGATITMSCAKDENLDDYKTRLYQQDYAKLASANGTYSGFAVAESDGKSKVGALQLTLLASSQEIPSNDQSRSTVQPVLNVNLDFQGESLSTIHTQSGSYDPASGVFQAQIVVSTMGSSTGATNGSTSSGSSTTSGSTAAAMSYTINMNGVLSADGTLNGTLEAQGFPGFGFKYSLQRNGQSLAQLASQATPQALLTHYNYQGQTTFTNGAVTKNVNLTILNPTTNSEQEFINVIVPTKTFIANLNYGGDAQVSIPNAQFDQRTGQLKGQTSVLSTIPGSSTSSATGGSAAAGGSAAGGTSGVTVIIYLACQQTSTGGFDCQHTTNSSAGPVAQTRVSASNGPPSQIVDDPNTRQQIQYQYKGTGKVRGSTATDPTGIHHPPVTKDFIMTVTYQIRSRLEEIIQLFSPQNEELYVQVGMNISDPDGLGSYGDYFPNAVLDNPSQTIQGNTTFSTPGNATPAATQLSCNSFRFVNAATRPYSFQCSYTSTLTNGPIAVTFIKR